MIFLNALPPKNESFAGESNAMVDVHVSSDTKQANETLFLTTLSSVLLVSILFYFVPFQKKKRLPPGPFPWPVLGNLLSLNSLPYRKLAELSKKYGSIMSLRLGCKYAVVVSSPEMAKEFLQNHDKSCASRNTTVASEILFDGGLGIVLAQYGEHWRKARKFANIHLFTTNRVKSWLPKRISVVHSMANFFAKEAKFRGGVVEVRPILSQGTMSSIMLMVANKHYAFASSGESPKEGDILMGLVKELLEPFTNWNPSDYIPFISHFDFLKVEKSCRTISDKFKVYFGKLIDERVEERKNKSEKCDSMAVSQESKDFLDVLLDLNGEDAFSKTQMIRIFQDMFVAGTDTSALTVEWALAELISHPEKMKKLKEELETVEVSLQTNFSKLPYLQAVIKETFRLHNVAPLLIPHKSIEEITVQKYTIPPQTIILFNAWAISHDPKVWPDPMAFKPERFLEQEIDVRGFDFRILPFGSGRRMCPGMNLGYSAVEIILSVLLKRFDWRFPPGVLSIDMSEKADVTMKLASPLQAHITEIKESC